MCREMIENVIAIATSASGAFCATIAGIVRAFSQRRLDAPERAPSTDGDARRGTRGRGSARRAVAAEAVDHAAVPRSRRSAITASSRMPPSTASW